ncbi:type II toxin-antitoxin system RelE/ParE family toxin [Myxococcota bacterium]|nr:type II toxin-antitoxin system RelE/ParE family toxin [Myxococcota bacterium]
MTLSIVVSADAEAEVLELASWWLTHRADSGVDIITAFETATTLLTSHPELGTLDEDIADVRWVRLKGTPYKLYYRYHRDSSVLEVLALWSGQRGEGPPLK